MGRGKMKVKATCTVPLKCKLPLSREMHLISLKKGLFLSIRVSFLLRCVSFNSLETKLFSLETSLVSREFTVSINTSPSDECTIDLVL